MLCCGMKPIAAIVYHADFDGRAEWRVSQTDVIWRLCCSSFAVHVYGHLDLIGAERSEKVVFVELRDIAPIA